MSMFRNDGALRDALDKAAELVAAKQDATGHGGHDGWEWTPAALTLTCGCGDTIPLDLLPTAGCPADDEPLIGTFEYPKYEFVCLTCGRLYGFLSPKRLPTNPATEARYRELKARWDAGERPAQTLHGRG